MKMTKPNKSKTNIAINNRYKDLRNNKIYKAVEFRDNYKNIRCQNQQKISVLFAVDLAEKYFTEL